VLAAALLMLFAAGAAASDRFITLASTTSTEQSGLFAHLLPAFRRATGIDVRVVAVGTGQALDIARRGDADVVMVHDRPAEDKLVAEGHGIERRDVMHNDFVLVGPRDDPARAKGADIVAGLARIAARPAAFVSRGDRSGTHAAELRYWREAGVENPATRFAGYRECGCGMGPAPQHRILARCVCRGRPGHVAQLQEPWRPRGPRRGRSTSLQRLRRHRRQPGSAPACEGGAGAGVRRLDRVAGRPGHDRRAPHRRRAALLSERRALTTPARQAEG
jgi:hypothetical protein